jgi:hypothetical protein
VLINWKNYLRNLAANLLEFLWKKERMIMIGGGVEHNPVSYTLFYEAKTEEAENYSQIFVSNSCAHCQMGC